jgi:putative endonuclease
MRAVKPTPHAFGIAGEDLAADYLRSLGYTIVRRNLRGPAGEIDIVATEGEVVVFVEVKSRRTRAFGSAVSAVGARKRRRMRAAAADYLQFFAPNAHARFDVLTIEGTRVRLLRGAFS